jgi:hypothetical protein
MATPKDCIAERRFEILSGKESRFCRLVFFKPVCVNEAECEWECEFSIEDEGLTTFRSVNGIDSLQALKLALDIAKVEVASLGEKYKSKIKFLGQRDLML